MYPVRYEADYVEQQSRAITFFRAILVIPWYIVGSIYAIAAFVVAFLAWFAIVFTGRYPEGLYNFNAGFLRMASRVNAFNYLLTDDKEHFGCYFWHIVEGITILPSSVYLKAKCL